MLEAGVGVDLFRGREQPGAGLVSSWLSKEKDPNEENLKSLEDMRRWLEQAGGGSGSEPETATEEDAAAAAGKTNIVEQQRFVTIRNSMQHSQLGPRMILFENPANVRL